MAFWFGVNFQLMDCSNLNMKYAGKYVYLFHKTLLWGNGTKG